jgi:N-sulfoglucosamine sulfohydrolase
MEILGNRNKMPSRFVQAIGLMIVSLALASCVSVPNKTDEMPEAQARTNIVLIVFEDMSPRIGAFGDPVATTPVLDAFAQQAVRYPNTFTASGVCAPSRSALITGVHQQTLGTMHMRTKSPVAGMKGGGPIEYEAVPPAQVKAFPELLHRAGYYTTNNGKTDYQFGEPFTVWDANGPEADWTGRAPGQPFFAMFNIMETHESYIWPEDRTSANPLLNAVTQRNRRDLAGKQQVTDPASVEVPPYLPDTSVVRADIARHYDNIAFAERQVQRIIDRLAAEGLLENTLVIVTTDHGDGFPRMKRTVYDSGIKVPMMVRFPDGRRAGEIEERLVSFVDLAPTILSAAGITAPPWVQGRDFIAGEVRDHVYAAADRHDEVPGRTKAVRDARFKYIRNYQPELAVLSPLAFRDALPMMQEFWRLAKAGGLPPAARRLIEPREAEELYDTLADPHEIRNLASDPSHAATLERLRAAMDAWIARTGDLGAVPEAEMVERMWPGLVQPVTAAPDIVFNGTMVALASATPGASIAYTLDGSAPEGGRIYTGPFAVPPRSVVKARAIRYGYAPSEVTSRKAE